MTGDFFLKSSPIFAGKEIPVRTADADEILILRERVSDSKRIALTVCTPRSNQLKVSIIVFHKCYDSCSDAKVTIHCFI